MAWAAFRVRFEPEVLAPIHAVFLSHAHSDHLDPYTLVRLWQTLNPAPALFLPVTLAYLAPVFIEHLPNCDVRVLHAHQPVSFRGVELMGFFDINLSPTNEDDVMVLVVRNETEVALVEADANLALHDPELRAYVSGLMAAPGMESAVFLTTENEPRNASEQGLSHLRRPTRAGRDGDERAVGLGAGTLRTDRRPARPVAVQPPDPSGARAGGSPLPTSSTHGGRRFCFPYESTTGCARNGLPQRGPDARTESNGSRMGRSIPSTAGTFAPSTPFLALRCSTSSPAVHSTRIQPSSPSPLQPSSHRATRPCRPVGAHSAPAQPPLSTLAARKPAASVPAPARWLRRRLPGTRTLRQHARRWRVRLRPPLHHPPLHQGGCGGR